MRNFFFIFLFSFAFLQTFEANSGNSSTVIIKKKIEGINFPVQVLKNDFISKNSLFVLEHRPGSIIEIQYLNDETKEPKINTILDLKSIVTDVEFWEQGVMGFAFSPYFETDKNIFVSYNNKKNQLVLSKFKYDTVEKKALLSSEIEILAIDRIHEVSADQPDHVCGTIKFNPIDNHLYFCTGDVRVPEKSQDINSFHGKILRINPFKSEEGKNYSIVKDNPFIERGGKPEILFMGFRNPWSFDFDSKTGDLYIPDVGSEYIEELNIVKYGDFNDSLNFGWSCFEGTYKIYEKHYEDVQNSIKKCKSNIKDTSMKFVDPSLQYFHDSIVKTVGLYGNSIIGGTVYKNDLSVWHNHYFFGDLVSSNIWYVDINKEKKIGINLTYGDDYGLTSITQIDDKLYATSFMGAIYEITLPEKKDIESSIYNRPLITKNLRAMKFINENNHTIFTSSSRFYRLLKKIRNYLDLLPF